MQSILFSSLSNLPLPSQILDPSARASSVSLPPIPWRITTVDPLGKVAAMSLFFQAPLLVSSFPPHKPQYLFLWSGQKPQHIHHAEGGAPEAVCSLQPVKVLKRKAEVTIKDLPHRTSNSGQDYVTT